MNRIETYCDLRKLAALREAPGPVNPGHAGIVIVANEFDESGEVTRSWFVLQAAILDGASLPSTCPPHTVVGVDLHPGEPTAQPVPSTAPGINEQSLHQLRKEQVELHARRERHLIYSAEWHKHLATIDRQSQQLAERAAEINRLNQTVADRDSCIVGYRARVAELQAELNQSREQLRSARKRKSLLYRVRLWVRQWR